MFAPHTNPGIAFQALTTFPFTLLHNGGLAVFVFFTLSGMVLSQPYYTRSDWEQVIRRRLQRRYARLALPILAACLLTYVFSRLHLFFNQQAALQSGSIAWLSLQKLDDVEFLDAIASGVWRVLLFGDTSLNTAYWTLGIEFQSSLFLMAFLMVAPRNKHLASVIIVMFAVAVAQGTRSVYTLSMLAGLLVHQFKLPLAAAYASLVMGLVVGSYQDSYWPPSSYPAWTAFTANYGVSSRYFQAIDAVAIVAGIRNGALSPMLAHPFSLMLGRASYPIYLTHFLFLCSLYSYLYITYVTSPTSLVILFCLYLCTLFSFSLFFHRIPMFHRTAHLPRRLSILFNVTHY